MAFTAADVKNLREMTGVGMMDCKKALTAADGDMDKAVEWLREKGLAAGCRRRPAASPPRAWLTPLPSDGVGVDRRGQCRDRLRGQERPVCGVCQGRRLRHRQGKPGRSRRAVWPARTRQRQDRAVEDAATTRCSSSARTSRSAALRAMTTA